MERRIPKYANLYRPGVHAYYAVTQISEHFCPTHCPHTKIDRYMTKFAIISNRKENI